MTKISRREFAGGMAAFAALGAGMLRSTLGSYTVGTVISGGLCVISALLILRVNRPSLVPAVAAA